MSFQKKNLGVVTDEPMKNRRKKTAHKSIFKDTFVVPEVEGSKNFVTL